jgi:hypothetical protein
MVVLLEYKRGFVKMKEKEEKKIKEERKKNKLFRILITYKKLM